MHYCKADFQPNIWVKKFYFYWEFCLLIFSFCYSLHNKMYGHLSVKCTFWKIKNDMKYWLILIWFVKILLLNSNSRVLPYPPQNKLSEMSPLNVMSLFLALKNNGEFTLWNEPAGNHGGCIYHLGLDICFLNTTTMISCRYVL